MEASVLERAKTEASIRDQGPKGQEVRRDMFTARDEETGKSAYSLDNLRGEAQMLRVAGSDTTSATFSAFFFYAVRNSLPCEILTSEKRSTFSTSGEILSGSKLSSYQYLRACLNETLRMAFTGPSEPSRLVLPGGLMIDNNFIPEGMVVGISGWSLSYNEEYLRDPFAFRPERLIVNEAQGATTEDVAGANSAFYRYPFSFGSANCAGQKLAILEMSSLAARTLCRMDVRKSVGDTVVDTVVEGSLGLDGGRAIEIYIN